MARNEKMGLKMKKTKSNISLFESQMHLTPGSIPLTFNDVQHRIEFFTRIFSHMKTPAQSIKILSGGTGIGKTTFIKQLGAMLGIEVMLIEVPHIVTEAVVQIPFLNYRNMKEVKGNEEQINRTHPDVVLAASHLATEVAKISRISDSQYTQDVASWPSSMQNIYNYFSPSDKKDIQKIRKKYRGILFLDEYWREVPLDVRNILRTILEKMIGQDKIGDDIYIIGASNIEDTAVEKPTANQEYNRIDYVPFKKQEFWHSLASNSGKPINNIVYNEFNKILEDIHFDYNEDDTTKKLLSKVRTSSRRLEEVIKYVNAAVPVKSANDAQALKSSIRSMFVDDNGSVSSLYPKVEIALSKIIKETSPNNPEWSTLTPLTKTSWDKTLQHQISTKMELGKDQLGHELKYVPIISGRPGIGKTSLLANIAKENNLVLVRINFQGKTTDDLQGLVVPEEDNKEWNVNFSNPALKMQIEKVMEIEKKRFFEKILKNNPNEIEKWEKQQYKYLLFFDEFNRVEPQVYNAVRRLILTKEFNHRDKLSSDVIVVAAQNPEKYDRTVQPLSAHMKDAMNIIDADPSWQRLQDYWKQIDKTDLKNIPENLKTIAKSIIFQFIEKFTPKQENQNADNYNKLRQDSLPFILNKEGSNTEPEKNNQYISPRTYDLLYQNLCHSLETAVANYNWHKSKGNIDEDPDTYYARYLWPDFQKYLDSVFDKSGKNLVLQNSIKEWFNDNMQSFMATGESEPELEDLLDHVLENPNEHLADDPNIKKYFDSVLPSKFTADLTNYFGKLIDNEEVAHHLISKKKFSKKIRNKEIVKMLKDSESSIERIVWELHDAMDIHKESFEKSNVLRDAVENAITSIMEKIPPVDKTSPLYQEYFNLVAKEIPDRVKKISLRKGS